MGIGRRIAELFRTKVSTALDRAEDPREVLDYSYSRQLEMLTKVRRGVADVATSRKRVELQLGQLRNSAATLEQQARQAVTLNEDDLAKEALTRRAAVLTQIPDLKTQQQNLVEQEQKLGEAAQRLQAKVEAFRTRKETIKAGYTAAEAQTRVGEAISGISEEMGDVGLAIQRAEDKTARLQARAGALDELLASGVLRDATLPPGRDDIQNRLDALTAGSDIEAELAQMRRSLPSAAPRQAITNRPEQEARP